MASSHRTAARSHPAPTAVLVLLSALAFAPAPEAAAQPSEQNNQCLGCHASPDLKKKLDSGETLKLQVNADTFANSVHMAVGCAGCHGDVDLKEHPAKTKDISSARAFSLTAAEVCRGCHTEQAEQWDASVHAGLLRDGNTAAPVCGDCHRPHGVIKGEAQALGPTICGTCHASVLKTYDASVHGQARAKGNEMAPACSGCHAAHNVKAASVAMGDPSNAACVGCHEGALDAHKKSLPNTGLHFDFISCPVCHAPGTERRVDLKLYDSATQQRVSHQRGVPLLESHTANGKGLDALALWNLLRTFNREGMESKTVLRGRLEVRSGGEAHQLADRSKATSDCKSCHRAGSDAFRSVTISLAGPGGRPLRYSAEKDVLSSVISLDSVGGFYAIGGTRIELLDILFLLALFAGIAIPIGHLAMRILVKQYLKRQAGASP
jgi:hypothetical protein